MISAQSIYRAGLLAFACSLLLACDSGSDGGSDDTAGIGGTGIAVGKVTDFGSIFVNGFQFDTTQSQFTVDGDPNATESDLSVGMVVLVKAETRSGSFNGNALEVFYDDEVEGPVAATPVDVPGSGGTRKTFAVFGQNVTIDETATVFQGTSFAGLAALDVVEISGFRISPNELTATYVGKKGVLVAGVTEVELRGNIQNLAGAPPNQTFMVDGTSISTSAGTELDVPGGVLAEDLFVEVEGVIQADSSVIADKVEFEDEDFGDEVDDVSLQGIISNYVSDTDFEINGQAVDAGGAQFSPAGAELMDGLEVEVEGDIVGGVLIADEVELREGETKLETFVSAINLGNDSFEVNYAPLPGSVVVHTDTQTLFEDGSAAQVPNFSLDQLNIGDFVRVEGFASGGRVTATIVKREDPDDSKLRGAVDTFVFDTSITILGITYLVDAGTVYEGFPDANTFFSQLAIGDLIKIEDDAPADGIADEVEEED